MELYKQPFVIESLVPRSLPIHLPPETAPLIGTLWMQRREYILFRVDRQTLWAQATGSLHHFILVQNGNLHSRQPDNVFLSASGGHDPRTLCCQVCPLRV